MRIPIKDIAISGIMIALIAVMSLVPGMGYIPVIPGVIDLTLIIIPVIVVGQRKSLVASVVVSTAFGVFSLIKAYIEPSNILSPCFQNPLISIVPRIAIGFTCYFSYHGFKKLFSLSEKKFVNFILPSALSAGIAVATNTILVLSFIAIGYQGLDVMGLYESINQLLGITVLTNAIPELLICVLAIPSINCGLKRANV